MNLNELAKEYDNVTGYKLVDMGVVGIPVFRITAVALVLEKKDLGPIEEFILRSADAGLQSSNDIAGLLGINDRIVETCLADLVRQEVVEVQPTGTASGYEVTLTELGKETAKTQGLIQPKKQTISFLVDGITGKPTFYPPEKLFKPKELKDAGYPEIRSKPVRPPNKDEVKIQDIIDVLDGISREFKKSRFQILKIESFERRDRLFLEASALAYKSTQGATQIDFVIHGRKSQVHQKAFEKTGAARSSRLFAGLNEPSQKLDEEGEKVKKLIQTAEVKKDFPAEMVSVYEHPPLLDDALSTAQNRLVINSPWIKPDVVNKAFLEKLRDALGRGVLVYIAYGFGEQRPQDRNWAVRELEKINHRYPNFHFSNVGNTHAKLLIKDSEFIVVSSFNWLSFKGDPNRTFREEYGIKYGDADFIENFFQKGLAERFDQ